MTTEVVGPPEHMWRDEFVAAKRIDPDTVFGYLVENYGGDLPPYEDVQFANADSAVVWRRLPDGEVEEMTPQNVMASGLVSIARKGFLLTPPKASQAEGVEDEVETGEPVATAEQPEPEAVVPVDIPLPPNPSEDPAGLTERFRCEVCDNRYKTSQGFNQHLWREHRIKQNN